MKLAFIQKNGTKNYKDKEQNISSVTKDVVLDFLLRKGIIQPDEYGFCIPTYCEENYIRFEEVFTYEKDQDSFALAFLANFTKDKSDDEFIDYGDEYEFSSVVKFRKVNDNSWDFIGFTENCRCGFGRYPNINHPDTIIKFDNSHQFLGYHNNFQHTGSASYWLHLYDINTYVEVGKIEMLTGWKYGFDGLPESESELYFTIEWALTGDEIRVPVIYATKRSYSYLGEIKFNDDYSWIIPPIDTSIKVLRYEYNRHENHFTLTDDNVPYVE